MGLDCVVIPSLILASSLSGVICLKSPRKRKMHYAIFIISLILFSLFCSLNNFIIKRDQGDTVFFSVLLRKLARALLSIQHFYTNPALKKQVRLAKFVQLLKIFQTLVA